MKAPKCISQTTVCEKMLSFYNYGTDKIQSTIWEELEGGLWLSFSTDAFLYNDKLLPLDIGKSQPLFPGFHQIIAGSEWNKNQGCLAAKVYTPQGVRECSLNKIIDTFANFINSLHAKRIGVHLSGGLDSTFIMAMLRELHVPFVPIGLKSETFEFRTERTIQDIILNWGEDGLLLDMEEYPYYSCLDTIPKHQIPDADIKSLASARALAKEFNLRGCDVVFTGLGGDTMFVEPVYKLSDIRVNIENEFCNPTENQRVYNPYNIQLISPYADRDIIDAIYSARLGQNEDPLKLWLRNYAESILPKELSDYSYCADFFGHTMWGLELAKPTIKILMEEAFDISRNEIFSKKNIDAFLNQDVFSFEHSDYIRFCGMVSIASWYHSLFNND